MTEPTHVSATSSSMATDPTNQPGARGQPATSGADGQPATSGADGQTAPSDAVGQAAPSDAAPSDAASGPPPWIDHSDARQRALLHAGTRAFAILALRLAGRADDPDLGDLRTHVTGVLYEFPWMAPPLGELLGLTRRVRTGAGAEDEASEAAETAARSTPPPRTTPEIVLGSSGTMAQFAAFGRSVAADKTSDGPGSIPIYLDTNGAEFFALSGGTGSGKSSTTGVIVESVSQHLPNLTHNKRRQCVISFVLHNDNHELLAGQRPNNDPRADRELYNFYGATPRGLRGLRRVVLPALVAEAQRQTPHLPVTPLILPPNALGARGWELLLGLDDSAQTLYGRTALSILEAQRGDVSLARFRAAVGKAKMPSQVRGTLLTRLDIGSSFMADNAVPIDVIDEGVVATIELRDPWMKQERRATLAAVLLDMFMQQAREKGVHVLFVFDEANEVLRVAVLLRLLSILIRQRRHLGCSLLLSDQDLLGLPAELLALASLTLLHGGTGAENLRHHIKANPKFRTVDPLILADCPPGEAFVLSSGGIFVPTLSHFNERARPVHVRRRASQPGGMTRTVV